MRILIDRGIVGVAIADGLGDLADRGLLAAQECGRRRERAIADLITPHCTGVVGAILRIEPDHHEPEIPAGLETGFCKAGSGNREDRAAERAAGEVGEDQYVGPAAKRLAETFGLRRSHRS